MYTDLIDEDRRYYAELSPYELRALMWSIADALDQPGPYEKVLEALYAYFDDILLRKPR